MNSLDKEFRRESQRLRKDTKVRKYVQNTVRDINIRNQEREKSKWLSQLKSPMFTLVLVENQQALDAGEFKAYIVRGWRNLILMYLDTISQHPKSVVWIYRGCESPLEYLRKHRTVSTEYLIQKMKEKYLHERLIKYC